MLAPDDRELLLDALRPPEGTHLDLAVGTTYTLDLQALLVAPLAFALFDWTVGEDGSPNIVALLESLRRFADRTTLFCQAGEIRVPRQYQPALTFLEDRVVPVTPPNADRIFHPKAWILRFLPEADDGPVRYRILCASRNLTFDRSWDTLLALDGTVTDDTDGDAGLVGFVDLLGELAPDDRPDVEDTLTQVRDELQHTVLDPPDGFDQIRFHTLDGGTFPLPDTADRTLVVSPFLTAGLLGRVRSTTPASDVLVSRPETLDHTPLDGWGHRYVLTPLVVQPDALSPARDDGDSVDETGDLQGLHAKIFLFEQGNEVRLFTGSANATDAAFTGNVELIAELVADRAHAGIDGLLTSGVGDEQSFRDLLDEHPPADAPELADEAAEHLERALDVARRRLGALDYHAHYELDGDDLYTLRLDATGTADLPDEIQSVRCWRISAGSGHAYTVRPDADGFSVRFGHVAGAGITAFFAVEITARTDGAEDSSAFVVAATVHGAPAGRRERVLTDLLKSRADVIRYLLFLLADLDGSDIEELAAALAGETDGGDARRFDPAGAPLLESLLKALRHDPSRLDHVASLLRELRDSDRGAEVLPDGIDEVWAPIWQVRQELTS